MSDDLTEAGIFFRCKKCGALWPKDLWLIDPKDQPVNLPDGYEWDSEGVMQICPKCPKTGELNLAITAQEFDDLLHWFMCSDPWPMSGETEHIRIKEMLDRLALDFGYDNWVVAFHELNSGTPKVKRHE